MNEPTDRTWRDDYTFLEAEGLLAHYTKASTAFMDILPGELRLSPYRKMRDPAEHKDIEPNIGSLRSPSEADLAFDEVYRLIKEERDRMRVLSLTRDAEARGGSFPEFDRCLSRPRMWEQYGDDHFGACLLFDRSRLERAVRADERTRHFREVEYEREASIEVFHRDLDADEILGDSHPARAAADHIDANSDAFFFLKSDDFETEWEYRVVLAAEPSGEEYAYLDYQDSLVAVALGERVPERRRPGAIEACARKGVKLGRLEWINGRPRFFPLG
jgi:hypothetical protein